MTLYELDRPDRDDRVTRLSFPSTPVTLTTCDRQGCHGDMTQWGENTGSSHPGTGVSAEMRMVETAEYWHNGNYIPRYPTTGIFLRNLPEQFSQRCSGARNTLET